MDGIGGGRLGTVELEVLEAKSTGSAVKAVLLSVEIPTEIYTVRRGRYANTQTRS